MFADHKSIVLHKKSDNSLKDTYFNRLSDKMNGYFTIHGTTLVNLLGNYGNFETDSNSDGLADGWYSPSDGILSKSLVTDAVFASKSQKLVSNGTKVYLYLTTYEMFSPTAGHIYFVSMYGKASTVTDRVFAIRGDIYTEFVPTSTAYERYSYKTATDFTTFQLEFRSTSGNLSSGDYALFDGIVAVDLTAAGALDPIRAAKYGVSNWSDLTKAQLEAEIPYFDSVMSVNVADGTASELTVENRGKNLIDFSDFKGVSGATNYDLTETGIRIYNTGEYAFRNASFFMNIKPGTYTLSADIEVISGWAYIYAYACDINKKSLSTTTYLAKQQSASGRFTVSSTFPNKTAYILISFHSTFNVEAIGDVVYSNVQIEEGSAATSYVPPRTDSITIPDSVELHGYNGVFDSIEYEGDSVANYTQRWKREDKNTDGGGAFALTDYKADTKIICRNKNTKNVKVLDANDSVDTDWNSITAEVWYVLNEAIESVVDLTDDGYRLPKLMNQIVVDSNLPIAMLINDEESVGYLHTQNFLEE